MRTLRLARIAAEAEGLRLHRLVRRIAVRLIFGIVGLGFLSGAVASLHVAGWFWLRDNANWTRPGAALLLAGCDLVIAALLAIIATRSSPGAVELEALQVRQRALEGATRDFALATMLMPTMEILTRFIRRGKS